MRRMYLGLTILIAVVLAVALPLGAASGATSIQPPTGPTLITSRAFTSSGDAAGAASYPNYFVPAPTAWWGIRSGTGYGGGNGLWCAQAPTPPTTLEYKRRTAGKYDIIVPQLADYYQATARFWYKYPSRGDADDSAFVVHWFEGPVSDIPVDAHLIQGLTSTGVTLEYDLTDPNNEVNLSRSAGGLRWRFVDQAESPGGSIIVDGVSVIVYNPTYTGVGASIDNVIVEGYAFGPVRDLDITSTAGGVQLDWNRPYAQRGETTLDARTLEYRIWRRPLSANPSDPWTELSASPLVDASTAVSTLDADASPGVSYAYLVAPYAENSTTAHGELQEGTGRVEGPDLNIVANASPTEIVNGENVSFTYTVSNNGSTGLTDVMVVDEWGAVAGPLTLAADESTVLPAEVHAITTSKAYQVTATSASEALSEQALSPYIQTYNPGISVSVEPETRHANKDKHADFVVSATNTSPDTELTNVKATLGSTTYDAGVLDVGDPPVTLNMSVPVSKSTALSASAEGTFLSSRQISDTDASAASVVLEPDRIAGNNRIATSIEAARRLYPSGITSANVDGRRVVVIATGYDFPDALSAASLAGSAGGPLLLVKPGDATGAVLGYIKNNLHADYAYIVGGTAVVSEAVQQQLAGIGLKVNRLAGANRYATALEVAREVERIQSAKGEPVDTAFVATGLNFPDALAASSLSAAMPAPVLLTKPDTLPSQTATALKELGATQVIVCGGTAVVSDAVENSIAGNPTYGKPSVVRMPGSDRYNTARLINEWGVSNGLTDEYGIDGVFLATGVDYPDALAGGALAGGADGVWRPLMLTKPTTLANDARLLILGNEHVSFVSVIGGTAVLGDAVRATAQSLFD